MAPACASEAVRLTWGAGTGPERRVHWPDPRLSGRSLCDRRLSAHEHEVARADRWDRWCRKNGCRQQLQAWLSLHAPSIAREYRARAAADGATGRDGAIGRDGGRDDADELRLLPGS